VWSEDHSGRCIWRVSPSRACFELAILNTGFPQAAVCAIRCGWHPQNPPKGRPCLPAAAGGVGAADRAEARGQASVAGISL